MGGSRTDGRVGGRAGGRRAGAGDTNRAQHCPVGRTWAAIACRLRIENPQPQSTDFDLIPALRQLNRTYAALFTLFSKHCFFASANDVNKLYSVVHDAVLHLQLSWYASACTRGLSLQWMSCC